MLKKESWLDLYQAPVGGKFDTFLSIFMYYFNLTFPPVKSILSTKTEKWITSELIKQKEEIICLSQTLRITKDFTLKEILKTNKKTTSAI